MSRVVALLALPSNLDDLVRVAAGLARTYPGAILGDSTDPRVIVIEDPAAAEDGTLIELRRAA